MIRNSRKSLFIWITLILSIVLFSTHPTFATESSNLSIHDPAKITIEIGIYENYPLSFVNEKNEVDGIFPSLIEYIAQLEEWNIHFVFGSFSEMIEALNNSEIDLLGAVGYTDERSEFLSYCTENVISNWGEILTHKGSGIDSFLDLEGKKIGVLNNDIHYTGESGIKNLLESFDINCTFEIFESYDEVMSMLDQGIIDAGVVNRLKGADYFKYSNIDNPNIFFNPIENYYVAPKNGNNSDVILSRIDFHLKAMKQDPNSEYYQILTRFFDPNISKIVIPLWVIVLLSGAIGIAVIGMGFNYTLRRQVKKRTFQLEKAQENYKRNEEKIRQYQKLEAVGLLAGGIAHDFNNILTVINGYSRLLLDMKNLAPDVMEGLQEIFNAGEKASALTKRLLSFSRRSMKEIKIIDINKTILNLDRMVRRLISEDVELTLDLTDEKCLILSDTTEFEQIILNLTINSSEAVKTNGRIVIRTHKESDNYVTVVVKDNGIGMTKEILDHLYEPFFTTKEVGKGTGLGLSTVYGIVKQLRGTINVETEIEKGTMFTILLPTVNETSVESELKDRSTQVVAESNNYNILLVEDNEMVQKITQKILIEAGYRIKSAKNGKEALDIIKRKKHKIDLVITDIVMPVMDGLELERGCRKFDPDLKFLFISGYSSEKVQDQGFNFDQTHFLRKPYSPSDLLRKTSELLFQQKFHR